MVFMCVGGGRYVGMAGRQKRKAWHDIYDRHSTRRSGRPVWSTCVPQTLYCAARSCCTARCSKYFIATCCIVPQYVLFYRKKLYCTPRKLYCTAIGKTKRAAVQKKLHTGELDHRLFHVRPRRVESNNQVEKRKKKVYKMNSEKVRYIRT